MGYAEGVVRRRGRRWQADVWVGGRRLRRSFDTRAAALAFLKGARGTRRHAQLGAGVTVAEAVDSWLDSLDSSPRAYAARTVAGYRSHAQRLVRALGDSALALVDQSAIDAAVSGWLRAGLSRSAAAQSVSVLNRARHHAAAQGAVDARAYTRPEVAARSDRPAITEPDLDEMLRAAEPEPKVALLLMSDCALRRGEVPLVRVEDVDARPARGGVHGWVAVHVRSVSARPKSRRGRSAPMTERLALALAELPPRAPGERLLPYETAEQVRWHLRPLFVAVGYHDAACHQLRVRAVTRWLALGIPPSVVQLWSGHASLSVLARYDRSSSAVPAGVDLDRSPDQSQLGRE